MDGTVRSDARDIAFEGPLLLFFAIWTVTGHIAFFSGFTIKQYWMLAWPLSLIGFAACSGWSIASVRAAVKTSWFTRLSAVDWRAWLAIGGGVVLTLCLHRPDSDDEVYLGLAAMALDAPATPFAAFSSGSAYAAGYVLSNYEFLRGGFSWLTGVPVLVSYYFVWPAVIAVMAVAYQCRLLRLLGVRHLGLALVTFFVVMLAWGEVHRTPPNFGFVRLFQGKGALIWVTIPAAIYYWLRFLQFAERKSLLLLCCAVIAGIGFSPTGVPTAVLLIGLFVAATVMRAGVESWERPVVAGLAGVAIYPLMIGLLMRFYFGHSEEGVFRLEALAAVTTAAPVDGNVAGADAAAAVAAAAAHAALNATAAVGSVWNIATIEYVLGHQLHGLTALGCMALLPFFLRPSPARFVFAIYSVICTLLLLFPWTSAILGKLVYVTFSWRWLYVVPFVTAIVLVIERLADCGNATWVRYTVTGAFAALFLAGSARWVVSEQNHTRLSVPGFKLAAGHAIFLPPYEANAEIDGVWLISPRTGARL
jgi:hypothetical protein